jgi:hypothetical protein
MVLVVIVNDGSYIGNWTHEVSLTTYYVVTRAGTYSVAQEFPSFVTALEDVNLIDSNYNTIYR